MSAFLLFIFPLTSFAQNPYLEPMGGSEVELYYYLDDQSDNGGGLQRQGEQLQLKDDDVDARYKISRGKVTEIHLDQTFATKEAAIISFDQTLRFLHERGIGMTTVPSTQPTRILRGEGNGMRSSLVLVPAAQGYRMEAMIAAVQ